MNTLGIRSPFPYRQWNVVAWIVGINLLAFFFSLNLRDVGVYFGMNVRGTLELGRIWQPLTYMFIHASVMHITFNMVVLLVFGPYLERVLGSIEFLVLYIGVGVLAGLFSLGVYWYTEMHLVTLVGASGAMYGAVFVFAVLNPRAMLYIMGIIPISARMLIVLYIGYDLLNLFVGNSNVAHMTHLAGLMFAALYCVFRLHMNPVRRLVD